MDADERRLHGATTKAQRDETSEIRFFVSSWLIDRWAGKLTHWLGIPSQNVDSHPSVCRFPCALVNNYPFLVISVYPRPSAIPKNGTTFCFAGTVSVS